MSVCIICELEFEPARGSIGVVCSQACHQEHLYQQWEEQVINTGCFPAVQCARNRHRRYLIDRHGRRCHLCSRVTWNGSPIPLVFDHINGNADDWSVDNCRLVCPNCDALSPTYKGRNRGQGRHTRRTRYKTGLSY